MTYNPFDRDDVIKRAGRPVSRGGWMDPLPDGFTTASSGGATVTAGGNNQTLSPGTTSGDEARLNINLTGSSMDTVSAIVSRQLIKVNAADDTWPPEDQLWVGQHRNNNVGLVWDITNERLYDGSTTVASTTIAPNAGNRPSSIWVVLVYDLDVALGNKTGDSARLRVGNSNVGFETVGGDAGRFQAITNSPAVAVSNGAGDSLGILYSSFEVWVDETCDEP